MCLVMHVVNMCPCAAHVYMVHLCTQMCLVVDVCVNWAYICTCYWWCMWCTCVHVCVYGASVHIFVFGGVTVQLKSKKHLKSEKHMKSMCTTCITNYRCIYMHHQLQMHLCAPYTHTCTAKHTFVHRCTIYTNMHYQTQMCA